MNVLFVSAEVTPFAKVGGLADVVGALPIALERIGVDVRILMPRYEHLTNLTPMTVAIDHVDVEVDGGIERVRVHRATLPNSRVTVYFLENQTYISQGPIYDERGTADPFIELKRFLFFSKAAVTVIAKLNWRPDVIHCHDWHTALIPSLSGIIRGTVGINTVLTIHNLAHQGVWNAADILKFLKLSEADHQNFRTRDRRGDFNLMQQGLLAASAVTTVSPTYAKEILTPEYGEGLDSDLKRKRPSVIGILNGIDTERFDPSNDPAIRIRYDVVAPGKKRENTLALHERCGLKPNAEVPTFAFIGRLAEQKGLDLILASQKLLLQNGARLIVLGTGMPEIERQLAELAKARPDQVYCKLGFDAKLAQQIYAGADMLLMPSKFEPCGLGQMVAMRYGTVPIVRSTGGLKDTVPDADADPKNGLGFNFTTYSTRAFQSAIRRARTAFADRTAWDALILRCMRQDLSWQRSAHAYLKLYESFQ